MAHRGRFFPVNFRRDFNANCDISSTTALAQAYTIELHSGTVPPYAVDGAVFVLNPTDPPSADALEWLSDVSVIAGHEYQLRLFVQIVQTVDVLLRATWRLSKDDFVVSQWRGVDKSRVDPLERGTLLTWQVDFTDFGAFPNGANFNFSHSGPVGY